MNIFFTGFNYNGLVPVAGDKIGAFDGELCVGVYTLLKDYADFTQYEFMMIVAYKEDKQNNVVLNAGFKEGNPIKLYMLVDSTDTVIAIPDSNITFLDTVTGEPLTTPVTYYGLGTALVKVHSGLVKLSISVSPAGKGETLPKAEDYLYIVDDAKQVTIKVDSTKIAEHYEFKHYLIDGVQQVTDKKITITMNKNVSVVAHFDLKKYTLTATTNPAAGTVLPESATSYTALTYADIFAKPVEDSGYHFSHWTFIPADAEVVDSSQAATQVKMSKNVQATAVFVLERDSLFVSVNPANSGTTTPLMGQVHAYDFGANVNLVATPQTGWKFKHWAKLDGATTTVLSSDSSYTMSIEQNMSIEAVFEKKSYTLRLQSDTKMGQIRVKFADSAVYTTADTLYSLPYGSAITLKAVSTDSGKYPFMNWSGAVNTGDNPVAVTVTTGMLIVANFEDTTPVELASFVVQYAPRSVINAVLLKWETASETNNFGFYVERAVNEEKNWQRIGFIEGAGTSSQQHRYEFIDDSASEAGTYYYRLKQVDTNGAYQYSKSVNFAVSAPSEYSLSQNYPNPFNPTTNIVFQIKEEGMVFMAMYDLLGRQVKTLVNESMKPGTHRIALDASDLSAGVYFYSLKAGSFNEMKKMTLIK